MTSGVFFKKDWRWEKVFLLNLFLKMYFFLPFYNFFSTTYFILNLSGLQEERSKVSLHLIHSDLP